MDVAGAQALKERIELEQSRCVRDRERAVAIVDRRHGYTAEFSANPEAHQREYDEVETELRVERRSR